jgi:hypothetical protein
MLWHSKCKLLHSFLLSFTLRYVFRYTTCVSSAFYCVLCKYFSLASLLLECMLDSCMFYRSLNRRNVSSSLRPYCRSNADLDALGHPSANQNMLVIGYTTSLSLLPVAAIRHMRSSGSASSREC